MKPVRERVLFVEQANHLLFRDREDSCRCDRGRRFKSNGMTREGLLTEEVAGSEHPDNGLSTRLRQHRELHGAFLNVENGVGRVALGENDVRGSVGHGESSGPCGSEKPVHVERPSRCVLHDDSSDYGTAVEAAAHIRGCRLLSTEY